MEINGAVTIASSNLLSSPRNSRQIVPLSAKLSNFSTIPRPIRIQSGRISRAHGFSGAKMSMMELEESLVIKKKASEIANQLKGTSLFLVGMNCTMKTDLGKLLADSMRYYYFDSDSLVEQAAGGDPASKSFRERDEKGFRDSETEVLKQLSSMGRLVVCAGDGAVQSSTNLAFMRYGISIWIDIPLDMVANEVLKTAVLSTITEATSDTNCFSEVLEKISKQYNVMREGFETSDARVSLQKVSSQLGYEDLDSVTPEDMAVEVLKEIGKLTRVKKMIEAAATPF